MMDTLGPSPANSSFFPLSDKTNDFDLVRHGYAFWVLAFGLSGPQRARFPVLGLDDLVDVPDQDLPSLIDTVAEDMG